VLSVAGAAVIWVALLGPVITLLIHLSPGQIASALTGAGSPRPSDHSALASDSALVSSTLFAATTTGLPDRRSTAATASSASVTPTVASTTNRTASDVSTATLACAATRAARLSCPSMAGSQPPVSTRVKDLPRQSAS